MYTPNKEHMRHILLFEFHKGNTASSVAQLSSSSSKDNYGNDVVNKKTCRRWFSAGDFKKDDFSLKDEPRTGCSKKSILRNWKLSLMKIKSHLHYWRTEQNLSRNPPYDHIYIYIYI
ncbi:unnamed protein product [Hymenolepis diminuta]|uniref:Mos1 transposase HTH domain-containing protein n=1 Tax=Hymenolepis diminuta TaxID=6216 RepID=A0A564YNZ7_HYMDI|nr:unnamed protein product [Hymenolepis diminuta]